MSQTQESEKLRLIDAWKQSIDVQKHFNELSLKIRNTATTVMGAGLAATGLIINENYKLVISLLLIIPLIVSVVYAMASIHKPVILFLKRGPITRNIKWIVLGNSAFIFGIIFIVTYIIFHNGLIPNMVEVSLGGITLFAVAVVMCIFYLLDRYWYHQLLKGTIEHAKEVESRLKQLGVDNYDIGEKIGSASPVKIGIATLHSKNKLDLVYLPIIFVFLFVSIFLMIFGNSIIGKTPITVAELNNEISIRDNEIRNLKKQLEVINAQKKASELALESRIDSVKLVHQAKTDSISIEFINYRLQHSKNAADSLKHIIPSVLGKRTL